MVVTDMCYCGARNKRPHRNEGEEVCYGRMLMQEILQTSEKPLSWRYRLPKASSRLLGWALTESLMTVAIMLPNIAALQGKTKNYGCLYPLSDILSSMCGTREEHMSTIVAVARHPSFRCCSADAGDLPIRGA